MTEERKLTTEDEMGEFFSRPCQLCGADYDGAVEHIGKSAPAAMPEIEKHEYTP